MKISKDGIAFIKQWEGCKLTAYKAVPTEKYYTVGIGHYGADVKKGDVITQAQAEQLLIKDVAPIETLLNNLHVTFTQGQFDALCSWIFNSGVGNFNSSTMRKYIIERRPDENITDQMVKWHNAGGKPLAGLKRRRVAEANLWLGHDVYYVDMTGKIKKHQKV